MRRYLGILSLFFFSQVIWAEARNEVVLGVFRQSAAKNYNTGDTTALRPGFGLGLKTESYPYAGFTIKLGLMFEQRQASDVFSGVEHNLVLNDLDLLTHLSYKATDSISIFAGPQYTVLLSKKCTAASGNCVLNESHAAKYFVPVTAGFDFTFMENYGVEVYYEWISQEVWEATLEKMQTYGLNLKYKF